MLNKEDLIEAMALECRIVKHLYGKLPREDWEATMAYRPSEGQRSTLELLRYIAMCGIASTSTAIEGSWDAYRRCRDAVAEMTGDRFPAEIDSQLERIRDVLAPLSDQDLLERKAKNPAGVELSLAQALYDMPIRWLIAYRMQLFLYAKALGADVATPDNWYGVSREK